MLRYGMRRPEQGLAVVYGRGMALSEVVGGLAAAASGRDELDSVRRLIRG